MQINIDVDLTSPHWLRRVLLLGIPVAAMAVASAVTALPKQYAPGETLKAADLNASFNEVDTRLAGAEGARVTVTAWANYTPALVTVTGTPIATAPQDGGLSAGQWRRVGDSIELAITAKVLSCPTNGVNLFWSIPPGVEVDYAKTTPYAVVGAGMVGTVSPEIETMSNTSIGHPSSHPNELFQFGGNMGTTVHCEGIGADGRVRFRATFPVKGWDVGN
jgi:hypothetical protein